MDAHSPNPGTNGNSSHEHELKTGVAPRIDTDYYMPKRTSQVILSGKVFSDEQTGPCPADDSLHYDDTRRLKHSELW